MFRRTSEATAAILLNRPTAMGALIQTANFASLVAQGFVVPRVLGGRGYGEALWFLTPVWLVHGIIETLVVTLTVDWSTAERSDEGRSRTLWRDALVGAAIAALAICAYSVVAGRGLQVTQITLVLFSAVLLILLVVNAIALGVAYSVQAHHSIWICYAMTGMIVPVGVLATRSRGALGFIITLCANQAAVLAMLAGVPRIRAFARQTLDSRPSQYQVGRVGMYMTALSPRLTQILLTSGIMLLGTWTLAAVELATLKMSLSLIGACANALPISAPLLLATLKMRGNDAETGSHGKGILIVAMILGILMSACLVQWGGPLRAYFLHGDTPRHTRFDVMFLAVPFFVLISPLSAFVIARGRAAVLRLCSGAALVGVLAAFALGRLALAFDVGAFSFVLCCFIVLAIYRTKDRF